MLWFLQLFTAPNSFFEIRTCFKCSNFHSWDFDFLFWISWVNTCSSFSLRRFECTKTLNSYFTTFFDRINDRSDKDSDEIPSESLGNTKFFCYQVNKLSFSHDRIIQNIKKCLYCKRSALFCKRFSSHGYEIVLYMTYSPNHSKNAIFGHAIIHLPSVTKQYFLDKSKKYVVSALYGLLCCDLLCKSVKVLNYAHTNTHINLCICCTIHIVLTYWNDWWKHKSDQKIYTMSL